MTDLGKINVISPAAGQVIDDKRSLQQGVATALAVGKDIAEVAVTEDLLGDLQATEILEGERAVGVQEGIAEPVDNPSTVRTYPMPTPGEDDEFLAREAEINRIVSAVDQSPSTAHRGRAILEMQKLVAQAKSKYPWAADRLDSAASRYMSTSYRLAELGLVDAASAAKANQAQSELSALTKKAEELGIDTVLHPVGSPGFINQFNIRSRREAEWERIEAETKSLDYNRTLSGREALSLYNRVARDASGRTAAVQQQLISSYDQIFDQGTRDLMALGQDQLSADEAAKVAKKMEVWNSTSKDVMIQALIAHKREEKALFDKAFRGQGGALVGTPEYEQGLLILEQNQADTDLMIEMVNTNSWDLDKALKARAYFMNSTNMHPKFADLVNMYRDPAFAQTIEDYKDHPTGGGYKAVSDLLMEEGSDYMVPILNPEAHAQQLFRMELASVPASADAAEQVRNYMGPAPSYVTGKWTLAHSSDNTDNAGVSYKSHMAENDAIIDTYMANPARFNGGSDTEGLLWALGRNWRHNYIQHSGKYTEKELDDVFYQAGSEAVYGLLKVAKNSKNKEAFSYILDDLYAGGNANGVGDTISRLTSRSVNMSNEVSPFVLSVSLDNFDETGHVDVALNGKAVEAYVDAQIAQERTSLDADFNTRRATKQQRLDEAMTKWAQKVAAYQDHASTLLRLIVNDHRAKGMEPDSRVIANMAEGFGLVAVGE